LLGDNDEVVRLGHRLDFLLTVLASLVLCRCLDARVLVLNVNLLMLVILLSERVLLHSHLEGLFLEVGVGVILATRDRRLLV